MKRTSVSLGIFVVLLLSNILFHNPVAVASGNNIIYVDGDNTNGPWDGTMGHPYQLYGMR